jgi:hypothetical protein
MSIRTVIGILILLAGFFWPQIEKALIKLIVSKPDIIKVDEPSEDIVNKISKTADVVTDSKDRLNLAIFNYVFSNRVERYEGNSQQINDVYVKAAKNKFGGSMKGKYSGLSDGIEGLFKDILGDENHSVSSDEKNNMKTYFSALAWKLNN